MKKVALIILLYTFTYLPSFSQSDTVYKYHNKTYIETTKDSAFTYTKFYKQGDLWHGVEYYSKNNVVKSEGNYMAMNFDKPTGSFNNYTEDGTLDNTSIYVDGKPIEGTFFYRSGKKKSWIANTNKGYKQKGWDENGQEIKNYIVAREAKFKGGPEGWKRYLVKHLNTHTAEDAGAPAGDYKVEVQFVISKEGYVSNVRAVSTPEKCKPCALEAVRVIASAPEWEPAVQHNEPAIYQAIQYVTFQVAPGKNKGRN